MRLFYFTLLASFLLPVVGYAQEELLETESEAVETVDEYEAWARDFEARMDRRTGSISLIDGKVVLEIPDSYYFLDAVDAQAVLEEAWGNPPDATVSGMLFPAMYSPLDQNAWGSILRFEDDGYVSDEDAESIDYDDLLKQMQRDTAAYSEERVQQGYEKLELVGWAESPKYDAATHKLYWAKELRFGDMEVSTLNYDVRALGRYGVLSMNFVASIDQLDEIKASMPAVLPIVEFTEGNRYADYQPGDRKADYGLAALVAGGAGLALAKKSGILAILLVGLKKFGVFILIGAAAVFGWLKRKLSGK